MRRIAVTGISGYIGARLLERLEAHPDVETIVGIDARPLLARASPKLRFFLRDISQPLGHLFQEHQVETVAHLAFVVQPVRDQRRATHINVDGTNNVIAACQESGVRHLVYLGSTAAYGAHPDNPVPLTEDSPLRPNRRFQYSREKAETDFAFQSYAAMHPEATVTILRGCVVMGPGGDRSIGAKMFRRVMVRVAGRDPHVQYVHEEDLIDLLATVMERRPAGVFNFAGDGLLRYTDVARLARRRMIALPKPALAGLMDATWRLRLQSESTSAGLDFITHPWVASNEKLKRATGFQYRYSSEDAVLAMVQALG